MSNPFSLEFDLSFEAAIAAARARGVVLPDEFYGDLQAQARAGAFTVSNIETVGAIQDILDSLTLSLEKGQTFREWQAAAARELEGLTDAHQETVFRTTVQTAYSVGHTVRQRENASSRPFLMWDAINDSRTRPTHHAMDGYIAPVSDPIWKHWSPPAGFNCRCSRISLTERQARARGYPMPLPGVRPDPGFDYEKADGTFAESMKDLLADRVMPLPKVIRDAVEKRAEPPKPRIPREFSGTTSPEFREKVERVLSEFPRSVLDDLQRGGAVVRAGDRLTNIFPDLKGVRPRGWSTGTWDNAEGLHRSEPLPAQTWNDKRYSNVIAVSETSRPHRSRTFVASPRIEGVLRHETGHALDQAAAYASRSPEFMAAYRADVAKIPRELRSTVSYYLQKGVAGPSEAFAEVFGQLYGGGAMTWHNLLETFPNVAEYIRKRWGAP